MKKMKILIIGSGVIGLSTGIKLLEAGYKHVTIVADKFSPYLTSDASSACFHPYITPSALLLECIKKSWYEFKKLQEKIPGILKNIQFFEYYPEVFTDLQMSSPEREFLKNLEGYTELSSDILPHGYKQGFSFETVHIDIPYYMPYLSKQFHTLGGKLEQKFINSLDEVTNIADIIINCTGFGAKNLIGDKKLSFVRGQAHSVEKISSIKDATLAIIKESEGYPTHADNVIVVPRKDDIYIAGTTQLDDGCLEERQSDMRLILSRAAKIVPELSDAKLKKTYVGIRPEILDENGVHTPRIEKECIGNDRIVIHNYGHAGAGVTASWGSAEKVTEILSSL
jgi:D-amino-acid oxidase